MGFFSAIARVLRPIARVVGGILGVAAPVAAVTAATAVRPAVAAIARGTAQATRAAFTRGAAGIRRFGPGIAQIGAGVAAGQLLAGGIAGGDGMPGVAPVVMGGGPGRGNGRFARQTTVQTIDLTTGAIVRSEVFSGAPFLMNNDVRRLRSIAKKVQRANNRLPRRTRDKSLASQVKDAALQQAITNIQACPPTKC